LSEALWRECRHFAKLIRLSHFAQKPSHGFLSAFARHPIDPARQSRQPTSLGDSQPGQADSPAHQYPLQDVTPTLSRRSSTLAPVGASLFEPFDAGKETAHHDGGEEGLLAGEIGNRCSAFRPVPDWQSHPHWYLRALVREISVARVEDAGVHLSGEFPGRAAGAYRAALLGLPFCTVALRIARPSHHFDCTRSLPVEKAKREPALLFSVSLGGK